MSVRDGSPAEVDLRFDATRIRGLGLKTGARYWANGVHQSRRLSGEFTAPVDLVCGFELLGGAPDTTRPTRLALTVRFRVTLPADGRVTVEAAAVEILPDSNE